MRNFKTLPGCAAYKLSTKNCAFWPVLGFVCSLHAAPGNMKWAFTTGGAIRSSPGLGTNGLIYFGSTDSKVYAIEAATGNKRWQFRASGPVISSPAISPDGTVFITSSNGSVYALDGESGLGKWKRQPGEILSSPALGANGLIYVATRYNGLVALNTANGQQRWSVSNDNWQNVYASPSVGAGGTVYCAIGGYSGATRGVAQASLRFYAFDGDTGRVRWSFESVNIIQSTPALGADGTVFIGSFDKLMYALDPLTGAKKWDHLTGDSITSSAALGPDGALYFGANDGKLYALDSATGAEKWTFLTGDTIHSSPAVAADATVYFGSYDKNVYALDGQTGAEKWRFATGGLVLSSPLIGVDGTVFIGSYDGKLYALESSSPLAPSPWPAFKGGAQRPGSAEREGPPSFLDPPHPQVVPEGTNTFLAVIVRGSRPISFQWLVNDQPLERGTNATLDFTSARVGDAGQYTVIASNALGQVRASTQFDVGYVLTIKPQAGGEATRDLEREVYLPGTVLDLTAKPIEGRQFLGWRGDAAGKANPFPITMDRHKQVAAKFETSHGEILWDFPAEFSWPPAVAVDDKNTVFLSSRGTNFVALDGDTGLLKWRFDAKNYVRSQGAVSNDGTLVFVTDPNWVFALESVSGKLKWRSAISGNINARPSIGLDGTVYVFHNTDSGLPRLSALNGATGVRNWQFAPGNGFSSGMSPVVGTNGLVYLTAGVNMANGCNARVYAIDASTGKQRWVASLSQCSASSLALGGDGTVYVESGEGVVHALDGVTGAERWNHTLANQGIFTPIVGADETIYLLGNPSASVALNGKSGQAKPGFDVKSSLIVGWPATPALSADGTLYAAGPDKLFALGSASGDVAWSAPLPPPNGGMVNIGPDGTIYLAASTNGESRLIAVRGTSALAFTPWPAAGGNERNTGAAGDRSVHISRMQTTEANAQVTILTRAGQQHQLEFKRSLNDREWTHAATVVGDGAEQTLVDPDPPASERFYRVRIE